MRSTDCSIALATERNETAKRPSANWLFAAMLLATALLLPLTSTAQTNFIYVNNQTLANSVSAYSVDGLVGTLSPVGGSPFLTGGNGANVLCGGLDRIVVSPANKILFVTNTLDQTVSAFAIDPVTGVLTAAPGSPFASGLTLDSCQGMSLAATPDGHFLMVSSNAQIKTFSVAASGALSLVATTANCCSPMVSMKISPNGQFLATQNQSTVSIYTINAATGALAAVPGSPFPVTGTGTGAGLDFSCSSTHLYGAEVSSATAITDAWTVAPNGVLSPILGSPFLSAGANSNSVLLSPDNTLLFQSNTASNSITSFTVNTDGTIVNPVTFAGTGITHAPAGLATANDGSLLYVADDGSGLSVFSNALGGNLAIGVLLPTPSPVFSPAGQIQGVAAYPAKSCISTDLAVTATVSPTTVAAGVGPVTYNITVRNNGPNAAQFTLEDDLPAGLTNTSCTATGGGVCDKGKNPKRSITFASLLSGQAGTVTITATTVDPTLLNGTVLVNTPSIVNATTIDPVPSNNSFVVNLPVTAAPSPSTLTVAAVTGSYFGSGTITATLKRTTPNAFVVGRTISFSVNGTPMGTAVTDASGIATLPISLAGINAGVYAGGISVSFAGDSQYQASVGSSALTINKAVLTVTAQNNTRVYGDPDPTFANVITGFLNNETTAVVSGTPSCAGSGGVKTAVGSVAIKCTVGTLTATNYSFTFVNATLTITPAPLVLAGTDVSRFYGDPNPALTGTVVGLKAGDGATATFTTTANLLSPVGAYPLTGLVAAAGSFTATNYTITSSGNLTVAPAILTATVSSATRVYGDANPPMSGTFTGLKNGDVVTATFFSPAVATSPVGTYPITATLTGANSANYTVSTPSLLTVTPAPLSVTASNGTRLYGDPNPTFTATIVGLRNADNITASFTSATLTSSVGSYPVVPVLVDPTGKAGNYTTTFTNGTLTVTPAPLTASVTSTSRPYGDPNPTFTGTFTGVKNGDAITVTFASPATTTSPVGVYPITGTVVGVVTNYTVTNTSGTLTVTPAVLTVAAANATRLYGDANPVFTGTISGIKNGEAITGNFASAAALVSPVGTYPITASVSATPAILANYTVVPTGGTLTVSPAPLTAGASNASRIYGDANPTFTGTITGLKNGDAITATFSTTATAASAVGTYPITASLVGTPAAIANYAVTNTAANLTVTPAALSVTAGNGTRLYGDPNPAFTATIVGLKNADNITASFSSAAVTAGIGTYPVVPALVDPTGKAGNYTVTFTNGTLTVTPSPLTASASNASRAYGDPNPGLTGTFTGLKNGDAITATFASTANATSPIGTYPITTTLVGTPALIANYTVATTSGTLTVTPALLTATAANATRLYGDANPVFTGTLTGVKNGEAITASFASTANLISAVGTYTITPSVSGSLANYTLTSVNGTLTISPAPLTASASNVSRIYGDANPTFSGTITGLKNGDAITATFATTATTASAVGTYPIVASLVGTPAAIANYAVTNTAANLTITPAALSVTASNGTRLYGDPNPAFTATITGLKNADNITASFSSAAVTASVGSYPVVPALVDPTGKAGNYTVTLNNGTLTVTPALLTAAAANVSRAYGDPNPTFTGTFTGLKNGDVINMTFASAATATSPVGTYPISATVVGVVTNYTVTTASGTLTVTPAVLTAIAANATRLYGDANPVFTGTLAGVKNGEAITASFASAANLVSAVGIYPITASVSATPAILANYTVVPTSGTLTVNPAPLSSTASNASRIYGDANPTFTGTITGLKNGDAITATFTTTATAASAVGTYPITATLVGTPAAIANYTVTSTGANLTVTAAPLSVTAGSGTRLYGDPNPAFTATIVGLKNADNITASFSSAAVTAGVGTYPVVPALVDTTGKAGNYTVTLNNGTLTITPALLTAAAANVSRAYGDANPAFTGTFTGLKNGDVINMSFASAATATSPVGTYPISATVVGVVTNYTVTTASGTLTVTPAVLTATAANATRLYGDPNPVFTGTLTGVKNGEAITASFASAASLVSSAGTYPITASVSATPAILANYTVVPTGGTLTVSPAPLSSTASSATRIYGDANPTFTGTISGLKNGDAIAATFTTTATAATAVGTYPITATLVGTPAAIANYTVTSTGANLTITPASLSVAASNGTRAYGDPNPAFTATITGLKNVDNITASFSSAPVTASVGTYPVVPALVDPSGKAGNYTVTFTNGTLTVTQAALTATVTNASRAYGDPNPIFTGTFTGLKNGDAITMTFASAATATSPVGSYPISGTVVGVPAVIANYTVTTAAGSLTVTPAVLTAAAANATRLYGDANPAFTGTLTGVKNGESITATFTNAATLVSPVGSYPITANVVAAPAILANYTVANSGTLTISPAPLTAAASNATRLYGDANPTFSGTITGLKNGDNITATFSSTAIASSPVGTYPVTATLVGTPAAVANYTVTNNAATLTVTVAPTTTTLAASSTSAVVGTTVTFTATVGLSSGSTAVTPIGAVTFSDGATVLGTGALDGTGKATFAAANLSVGSHTVTAAYAGNTNTLSSTSASVSASLTDFSLPPTVPAVSVPVGQSKTTALTVTPAAGFTGTVSFICSVPANMTEASCSASPVQISGAAGVDSVVTINTTGPHQVATNSHRNRWLAANGFMFAAVFWFGIPAWTRRRVAIALIGCLVIVLLIGSAVGCGGGGAASASVTPPTTHTDPGTPAGTYVLTVTALSGTASHTMTLSVTVQ